MKTILIAALLCMQQHVHSQQTIVQYLSGTDKDHTVQWDFLCTSGMQSNQWSKIPVPSCWEEQGFGTFNYFEDKINPDETGFYKYSFTTQPVWKNKKIFIVFEGSMTDTEVKIDGVVAGPIHQGAFTQFRYDITDLISRQIAAYIGSNCKQKIG